MLQVRAVRALVYVLKRLPPHANKEQEEASQVLTQVLRVVNNVDESNNESRRHSFQGVVDVLAAELFNSNASHIVRKNVQSCLALLASRTGSEVSELLEPLYQPLLQPLVVRPLRSKHVEQQVGHICPLFLTQGLSNSYSAWICSESTILHSYDESPVVLNEGDGRSFVTVVTRVGPLADLLLGSRFGLSYCF